jgi:hypothetical protein
VELLLKQWDLAKDQLTIKGTNNKLLLVTDREGLNRWHVAAYWDQYQRPNSKKVWNWAKEKLTREELRKLLLAADHEELTAWHVETYCDQIELLRKVWDWANETLIT